MELVFGQRLIVHALVAVLALSAFAGGVRWEHLHEAASPANAQTTSVMVHPGDTLWSIAGRIACGRDTRTVTRVIVSLNQLPSHLIQPGQRLLAPAYPECG